jgi:integrase
MATVSFRLHNPEEGKKATILCCLYISDQIRPEYSTGERVLPISWQCNRVIGGVKGGVTKPDASHINLHLSQIETDLLQMWRDNKQSSAGVIKQLAKKIIKGNTVIDKKKLLSTVLKAFITWMRKDYSPLYVKKFETLERKLTAFNPNLQIDELDNEFYDSFKDHLYGLGQIDSTVYKTFTNICTFLDWACNHGYDIHQTNHKPTYKSWEIIYREPEDPISFTTTEFAAIENVQITEELINDKIPPDPHGRRGDRTVKALELTRDYVRVECRTAQRISDVKRFDLKDVVDQVWINRVTKGRQRKQRIVRVPFDTDFTGPAWEILRKHNFKLPTLSEQKLNKNIRLLARLAGITKVITVKYWVRNEQKEIEIEKCDAVSSHTLRKTFITIGLQYMMPKIVKDLAGISWNTLKHYEGNSEDETLREGLKSMPLMKIAS